MELLVFLKEKSDNQYKKSGEMITVVELEKTTLLRLQTGVAFLEIRFCMKIRKRRSIK